MVLGLARVTHESVLEWLGRVVRITHSNVYETRERLRLKLHISNWNRRFTWFFKWFSRTGDVQTKGPFKSNRNRSNRWKNWKKQLFISSILARKYVIPDVPWLCAEFDTHVVFCYVILFQCILKTNETRSSGLSLCCFFPPTSSFDPSVFIFSVFRHVKANAKRHPTPNPPPSG